MTEQTADDALVEALGCTLWRADIERTGTAPSIAARRTPEAFADHDPDERAKWLAMARAILPILTRRDRETWNRAIEAGKADLTFDERETINLLRREAKHSGVWFAHRLTIAADLIERLAAIASLKDQGHG